MARQISQHTWKIIQDLREKSPRHQPEKTQDQIRAEAQERLNEMAYADSEPDVSPSLKAVLDKGRAA